MINSQGSVINSQDSVFIDQGIAQVVKAKIKTSDRSISLQNESALSEVLHCGSAYAKLIAWVDSHKLRQSLRDCFSNEACVCW